MVSERCEKALVALKSDGMPLVIDAVMRAKSYDNSHRMSYRTLGLLEAISDPYADALLIIMYTGRDEFSDGHPYDEMEVDTQLHEWWEYLRMEHEHFGREVMAEKLPLDEYLRKGAYMFGIDMGVVA